MHDKNREPASGQQAMTTTPATSAARYPLGPSKSRPGGVSSAPGVAEELGHQGVPECVEPADDVVRRVAQRRKREEVQRTARVDVRYSDAEKAAITAQARKLNISAAHFVGATVMAHLEDRHELPGQRTELDDCIDRLDALRAQSARIGNNVNQIARRLNAGELPQPGDTAVLHAAQRTLVTVRVTIDEISRVMNQVVAGGAVR